MENNFVGLALQDGGALKPLILPSEETGGTGLMNPSILYENSTIKVLIRHVNYTFYHSEKKLFQHPFGPLTYLHPENDIKLRTWNWYCELDDNLDISSYCQIDTSKFDTYEPRWEFVGLEDARLVRWDDKLYHCGVRRDTTENGEGRMELSKLSVGNGTVVERSRIRIQPPNNPDSYCEKNWMPILDKPYHFVKWSNPTEVVKVDNNTGSSETVFLGETKEIENDQRGGTQLVPYKNGYLAIVHEVFLGKDLAGRKDGKYAHRFLFWDKDFNLVKMSDMFFFMSAQVEFATGMADYKDSFLITFGFQDNAAFILKVPKSTVDNFVNIKL